MMKKTAWIARTAICLALLLCLQFVTKSLGQFVTGSCVNLVIAMAALIWSHQALAPGKSLFSKPWPSLLRR